MKRTAILTAGVMSSIAGLAAAQPFVGTGDVVIGLGAGDAGNTIQIFDPMGMLKPDSWTDLPFAQGVEFDNRGGLLRNGSSGNLLSTNFGTIAGGGGIYIYESGTGWVGVNAFGGNAGTIPPAVTWAASGLERSRLGAGLAVSPNNARITFSGNDSDRIYVLNYDAALRTVSVPTTGGQTDKNPSGFDISGASPSVSGGVAWLDNNTIIAVDGGGRIVSVNANNPTSTTLLGRLAPLPPAGGSVVTDVEYVPEVSPFVYINYSSFFSMPAPGETVNVLFVYDPRLPSPWATPLAVKEWSPAIVPGTQTGREIALSARGELFVSVFGGTGTPGATVSRFPNVLTPSSIPDPEPVWASTLPGASFSGVTVAMNLPVSAPPPPPPPPACPVNCNGDVGPTGRPLLDVQDFSCFQNAFALGDLSKADVGGPTACSPDGRLDISDFSCFQNLFAIGCP